jgi:hypothetical protein
VIIDHDDREVDDSVTEGFHISQSTKETICQLVAGIIGVLSAIFLPFSPIIFWFSIVAVGPAAKYSFVGWAALYMLRFSPILIVYLIAMSIVCYRTPSVRKLGWVLIPPTAWFLVVIIAAINEG